MFTLLFSALKYLHASNVIHGNIRPLSLLISENGLLKISDFYMARLCNTDKNSHQKLFEAVLYMAPEVIMEDDK